MKRVLAATALAATAIALTAAPSASASAAPRPHLSVATGTLMRPDTDTSPLFSRDISLHIKCASWKGELSWGGNGSILFPAFIDISGTLKDTCSSGHAQLFLHYDTIDNPKEPKVKQIGPLKSAKTPFTVEDRFNTYKDIYVYICSEGGGGHRCSGHKGPGA
jgi:hypothetical protein